MKGEKTFILLFKRRALFQKEPKDIHSFLFVVKEEKKQKRAHLQNSVSDLNKNQENPDLCCHALWSNRSKLSFKSLISKLLST